MLDNKIEFDISSFYDGCSNVKKMNNKEHELFDDFVS